MGYVADNTGRPLAEVSKPLRRMLKRYGISAAEWDVIRAAPLVEHEGARFFDPANVSDRAAGEKLMEAIIQERAFAVLEPDSRVRGFTTGGLQRGTIPGEIARSAMLFKSFAVTMLTTHMMRAAQKGSLGGKLAYFGAFTGLLTISGAVALQARQIIQGKDPRRMDDRKFWGAAFIRAARSASSETSCTPATTGATAGSWRRSAALWPAPSRTPRASPCRTSGRRPRASPRRSARNWSTRSTAGASRAWNGRRGRTTSRATGGGRGRARPTVRRTWGRRCRGEVFQFFQPCRGLLIRA